MPWGPKQVGIGLAMAFGVFVAVQLTVLVFYAAGYDFRPDDVGDIFVKAGKVAQYADERLQSAANSAPLPAPPDLLADRTSLEILIWINILSQVAFFGVVGLASGQTFRGLVTAFGLDHYALRSVWRPALAMIAAYVFVVLYSILAESLGIGILEPRSTVPTEILRYGSTTAAASAMIVIGAPVSEEFLFRGFMFGGLLRWGFWPAAALSSLLFTLLHFDPGSVIPFFCIGLAMCWLFRSRGTLWDSMIFHCLFNSTSLIILLSVGS